jgi:hypothetical protein
LILQPPAQRRARRPAGVDVRSHRPAARAAAIELGHDIVVEGRRQAAFERPDLAVGAQRPDVRKRVEHLAQQAAQRLDPALALIDVQLQTLELVLGGADVGEIDRPGRVLLADQLRLEIAQFLLRLVDLLAVDAGLLARELEQLLQLLDALALDLR